MVIENDDEEQQLMTTQAGYTITLCQKKKKVLN